MSRASERGLDFVCPHVVIYRGAARVLARHARACKSDLSTYVRALSLSLSPPLSLSLSLSHTHTHTTYVRAAIPDSIRDEIARKIRDCLDQPGKAR